MIYLFYKFQSSGEGESEARLLGFSMAKEAPVVGEESRAYSPVYCVDELDSCEKIPHICEIGPCLQDECFFENYCYRLEKRGKKLISPAVFGSDERYQENTTHKIIISEAESIDCLRGKPAAIESRREYDYFLEMANTACKI
jgi:hypothetical protein